jgi:hypothetical protein
MGLNLIGSKCRCNDCSSVEEVADRNRDRFFKSLEPDPQNFRVKECYQYEHAHVLVVEYPNCTNYEGKKILVRRGEFDPKERFIDPHFCENTRILIARFEPSPMGLILAKSLGEEY